MISPFGVEASLKALEALGAGNVAQRAALSGKLDQLEYEAKKAFELDGGVRQIGMAE